MNSVDYEVDSGGSLMTQILALTAPPGSRQPFQEQNQSTQSSNIQERSNGSGPAKLEAGLAAHPYFRRPGRGHNHDNCDACSEGGDLICCDLCPASFHLTCHDPPLDEDDIPTGEWMCHQCRMGGNEDEKNSCSSVKSIKNIKGIKRKEKDREEVGKKDDDKDKKVRSGGREFKISNTPLSTLIRAAAVINPTQFTLPYELTVPVHFPGEPKETTKRNGSRRGMPRKKPYELDNGLVPLPAKLCFQCNKSCRIGPLIPCDFCSLFFHLDCLDPPLTSPPMGRWMCPNHPEHMLDTTLLTSHGLTERVRLWDKCSGNMDQDKIKLTFLQRCHRLNPPFRYKVKKALRSRIRVPAAIKTHYLDPPLLLPHLSPSQYLPIPKPFESCNSFQNPNKPKLKNNNYSSSPKQLETISPLVSDNKEICAKVEEEDLGLVNNGIIDDFHLEEKVEITKEYQKELRPNHNDENNYLSDAKPVKPTKEEETQWLSGLLGLQSSIIKHMVTSDWCPPKCDKRISPVNGYNESDSSLLTCDKKQICFNGEIQSQESSLHKMSLEDKKSFHINNSSSGIQLPLPCHSNKQKSVCKSQKSKPFSSSTSRHNRCSVTDILTETLNSLEVRLKKKLESDHEVTLSSLEKTVVEVLAYERLKEIMEPNIPPIAMSTPILSARALVCPLVPDVRLKKISSKTKEPLSTPVPMTYRMLNIGKGSQNQVDLDLYGHCNYVSNHHASIVFDEMTGHYELLNYSEFCTKVDGVTYNCTFNEKSVAQAAPPPILQQIKDIINKRRGLLSLSKEPSLSMSSRPGEVFIRCQCRKPDILSSNSSSEENMVGGWEGAAILHHGSYMRFGCLQFVFSIVEEASKGDWADDTAATYEKFIKQENEEREALEETIDNGSEAESPQSKDKAANKEVEPLEAS